MTAVRARESAGRVESRSPQAPADLVAVAEEASAAEVQAAVVRARAAQRAWWTAGGGARAAALADVSRALHAGAPEAVELVVREVGKPVLEARAEVARACSILDFYAQQAFAPAGQVLPPSLPGMLWTERRPHGVAGLVTPWNFPLAIPLWKAAPAWAAGNAVLLKPSPEALGCAQWLADLVTDRLPDGLLQVLPGGAITGQAVVDAADVVSFTGSAAVGQQVAASATRRGVPVQAEMGGQNAAIVLPDADAGRAATMIASAAMGFAGQKCTATRRVVVVGPEARQREVAEALVGAVDGLRVGDPGDERTHVGPVITDQARRSVSDGVAAVRAAGGRVLRGGEAVPDGPGWYVRPAVSSGIPADHQLAQEELFGPFVLLLPAAGTNEAVTIAEGVRYGLVTGVHGRDADQLLDVVSGLGTGMVKVNAPTTGVDFYAPFGGERDSSVGPREQGTAALDFYTSTRTVTFARHG